MTRCSNDSSIHLDMLTLCEISHINS